MDCMCGNHGTLRPRRDGELGGPWKCLTCGAGVVRLIDPERKPQTRIMVAGDLGLPTTSEGAENE